MARKQRPQKVRTRSRLPAAMDMKDWLQLVLKDQPARNRLGAMVIYQHEPVIVAWLGGQIHAVPIGHGGQGGSLHASLEPKERQILEAWMADVEAGRFRTLIERAVKKSPSW